MAHIAREFIFMNMKQIQINMKEKHCILTQTKTMMMLFNESAQVKHPDMENETKIPQIR